MPPPPPPLWTGLYVGLNAGGAWSASNNVQISGADLWDNPGTGWGLASALSATSWLGGGNNGGFIGGGQIGYNYQFTGAFVAGIEADIQGVTSNGTAVDSVGAGVDPISGFTFVTQAQVRRSLDYLGTVRGRIGFLFTPTLLAYATGGLAYGGVNLTTYHSTIDTFGLFPGSGVGAYSDTRVGWTVGGGLEWMFNPNWSAKVEYLYYDLGHATVNKSFVAGADPTGALGGAIPYAYAPYTTARFDGHVVRAGVNYHFNLGAPAPVVAKY